jgi:UDP-hydrolysing UDP-N-acetyl-D-glucosamine 2-epimerase
MKPRRIHFFSAARSDYDLMAPVIAELRAENTVEIGVIAAAAHMSPFHGMSVRQIEEDGVLVVGRLETLLAGDSWSARSLSFAQLTEALTRHLGNHRPDLLFVAGDREEHLAAALVANFLRFHVAHLHGGDRCLASDIDEVLRPAISKLAHFHFPATEGHRERLIRMGENPGCIWACGAPGLDRLRTEPEMSETEFAAEFGVAAGSPFFLVIQHPSSTLSTGQEEAEMGELLAGVLAAGHPVFCSYPNIDPGNVGIRKAIDAARAVSDRLQVYHNLPRNRFVALYRRCAAIVGNSSSLVVESAFLKVPAILVGPRQDMRDRGANVLRVDFSREEVAAACRRALEDAPFRRQVAEAASPYGDGHAAARIARLLATVELDPQLLLKTIPY